MKLVKSNDFRSRLAEAARITMTTGHESAFSYVRYLEAGSNHFSPVFEGMSYCIRPNVGEDWTDTFPPDASLPALLDLHLHPQYNGPLLLSETDIWHIDEWDSEYNIRPVAAIGTINQKASGHVLLLQKDFPGYLKDSGALPEQLFEKYCEVEYRWPSSDFGRLIEIPGFVKADILRFRLRPGTDDAYVVNPNVIGRFGYQGEPTSAIRPKKA